MSRTAAAQLKPGRLRARAKYPGVVLDDAEMAALYLVGGDMEGGGGGLSKTLSRFPGGSRGSPEKSPALRRGGSTAADVYRGGPVAALKREAAPQLSRMGSQGSKKGSPPLRGQSAASPQVGA